MRPAAPCSHAARPAWPRTPSALAAALLLALAADAARAGAVTDGSTGAVQSLSGQFTVPQSLGTLRGANLFHSFARFGLASGESATFTTTDPGIRHVISRVTGGAATTLDGLLRLQPAAGSAPDFWLLNPAGILVGAGAQFDLPAGLHLSTAPRLRLTDGSEWDARSASPASSLSVAAPESFGFLGPAARLSWQQAGLQLVPGATLTLSGGDVAVSGAALGAAHVRLQAQQALHIADGSFLVASAPATDTGPVFDLRAAQLTIEGGSTLLGGSDVGAQAGSGGFMVDVSGALRVLDGSSLLALNFSEQAAGAVSVRAGSLQLAGGALGQASIGSRTTAGTGAALMFDIAGAAQLADAEIFSLSAGPQGGGALSLRARSLTLDGTQGLAQIDTRATASGRAAGALTLQVDGALELRNAGRIVSDAAGNADSGAMRVQAGSLLAIDTQGNASPGLRNGAAGGAVGGIDLRVAGALQLLGGGSVASFNRGGGAAAAVQVQAGSMQIDGGGGPRISSTISSYASGSGGSADLHITATDRIALSATGQIATDGGGRIRLAAPRIVMDGPLSGDATLVSTHVSDTSGGAGGDVDVQAGELRLSGQARIWSLSDSEVHRAGAVTVTADTISLDAQGSNGGLNSFAQGAGGSGALTITARKQLDVLAGASISGLSLGAGSTAPVTVSADVMRLDGRGASSYTGIGGDAVTVGNAAPVAIRARRVEVLDGAVISSATYSAANGGAIQVTADELLIDGLAGGQTTGIMASTFDAGTAGAIELRVGRLELRRGGAVDGDTLGSGSGGNITVRAGSALLSGGNSGLFSIAAASGAAGQIDLRVDGMLEIQSGAGIAANTGGSGAAGRVRVSAGQLSLSGQDAATGFRSRISSRATPESGGQAGSLTIDVTGTLRMDDQALLSVANQATLAPGAAVLPSTLQLRAGSLQMTGGAEITAAASANANAGALDIAVAGAARVQGSLIRTSSLDGHGGPITLTTGQRLTLRDAQVTTSVEGRLNGNGGDITIRTPALVLQSGVIQANTAAPAARGGRVSIDAPLLLPDGSQVFIGGTRIATLRTGMPGANVIQAAAPDGVSGTLAVTLPQLDLAASLVRLITPRIEGDGLTLDRCEADGESGLSVLGRGALRPASTGPARIEP